MNTFRNYFSYAALCALLVACGGGGGGSATTPPPTGGIVRTGVAAGPITTFGSIVVNGVHYNTDSATFIVNDSSGTQADLSVGQIVSVQGTIDANGTTGTANTVIFDDTVKGPVQSIDTVAQQIVVLGQTVLIRAETSFDDRFVPASLEGVSIGQIVEVSGQFDANGDIVANRIEPKPAGTQFEVHGTVANLDTANLRFSLGNLVVDYSAAILDNFVGGQISDGDFVEAKGASLNAAGELVASKVELESLLPGADDGDFVELEGFITRFDSEQDFDIAGHPVTTTSSTRFVGGAAADLGLNIKVEAEGTLDGNGTLVAEKIDFRRGRAVRVMALADSVNAAADSLVVLGITVNIDELTRMEDKSDADVSPLSLANINSGDYVEIRGTEFPAGSGTLLAGRFEREDPDQDTILQGFVVSIGQPSFEILGVTIETNGATVFQDINDNVISAADFFSQVAPNSLVKAKGTEVSDSTLVATEVEFQLEL